MSLLAMKVRPTPQAPEALCRRPRPPPVSPDPAEGGTGLYPKPTESNLHLPMQFFLKNSLYVSLPSTQTSLKKFGFSEQNVTSIGNVHACCVPRPSTPDFTLKIEYTIHLILWFHAHLKKNKGLSRYEYLWWNNFWKRIQQDSNSGVSCLRSLAS